MQFNITAKQRADGYWMAFCGDSAVVSNPFTTEQAALTEGQRIMQQRKAMNEAITVPAEMQAKFDAQEARRQARRAKDAAARAAFQARKAERERA